MLADCFATHIITISSIALFEPTVNFDLPVKEFLIVNKGTLYCSLRELFYCEVRSLLCNLFVEFFDFDSDFCYRFS